MDRRVRHGLSNTRIFHIYNMMIQRCYNPKNIRYTVYGGKGIHVCDEWKKDIHNFVDWALSHGYKDDLTIDRIDSNGNYEPSNCRWATQKEQQNNRSNNVLIEIDGQIKTIPQWAEISNLNRSTIRQRYNSGIRGNDLLKPLKKEPILVEINGRTDTLAGWSRSVGLKPAVLQKRYRLGWRGEKLLSPLKEQYRR